MTRNRRVVTALVALAAAGALPGSGPAPAALPEEVAPAANAAQTLVWSPDLFGTFTHPGAVQAAAAYTGGGYTDWRLPTLEELRDAVTDADPNTFGQSEFTSSAPWYWSSKKQGSAWAFAVEVYTDAGGYPIPSASGRIIKTPVRSSHPVKCVRQP